MVSFSSSEFSYIQKLIYEQSAIVIEPGKEYLVEARLSPLAHQTGCASISDLITRLRLEPNTGLHRVAVEAMTTNETSFFRDVTPFEALKKEVIPQLIARRAAEKTLSIWCAASSTGQEPYSLAMLLREHFPVLNSWKLYLMASDISTEVLARARQGKFSQLEVNRGLPASMLVKYFHREGLDWQISDQLRRQIEFREINLAKEWPYIPMLDLVLMRNVLIYFDIKTKKEILEKTRRRLKSDGVLFLGTAETTLNLDDSFVRNQFEQTSYYQIKPR
ncbi:MAG TPA: protein-glutamate O-methyltransferase CheR [Acidobacteriota bacterium]|nr:protein-glutamate O-methyltransferase CheR [Acidobacteriota bacterium]